MAFRASRNCTIALITRSMRSAAPRVQPVLELPSKSATVGEPVKITVFDNPSLR